MPFPIAIIEPRKCGRNLFGDLDITCQMPSVNNFLTIKILNQIGSLQECVNVIFEGLFNEMEKFTNRLEELNHKIESFQKVCNGLDEKKVQVGQGFGMSKKEAYALLCKRSQFFNSTKSVTLQLISRETRPVGLQSVVSNYADPVIALHLYDNLRADSKISLKLYSDVDLFFLAWKDQIGIRVKEHQIKNKINRKHSVRQTRNRAVQKPKESRIQRAQKLKEGKDLLVPDKQQVEILEYIHIDDEEDWFSSDDDDDDFVDERTTSQGDPIQHNNESTSTNVDTMLSPPIYDNVEEKFINEGKILPEVLKVIEEDSPPPLPPLLEEEPIDIPPPLDEAIVPPPIKESTRPNSIKVPPAIPKRKRGGQSSSVHRKTIFIQDQGLNTVPALTVETPEKQETIQDYSNIESINYELDNILDSLAELQLMM